MNPGYARATSAAVVLCSRISATTTSYGVLSGSRQGKERPFRLNQERSRLRNQGMRSSTSDGSSPDVCPGCPITFLPFLERKPPHLCHRQGFSVHCFASWAEALR